MDRSRAREFLRGSSFAFVGSIGSKALNYVFLLVAVRVLSEATFGAYVFLIAVLNLVQRFGMLGINKCIDYYVPTFLNEGKRQASRSVLVTTISMIALVGIALGAGLVGMAGPLATIVNHPDATSALVVLGLSVPVYMYLTALQSTFHAVKQIGYRVVVNDFLYPGSKTLLLLMLISLGFGLVGAAWAFVGSVVIAAIVGTALFVRTNQWVLKGHIEMFDPKRILEYSLPMTASVVTAAIIGQIDVLMLGFFRPSTEVGFYRLAYSVAMLPTVVPPMLRSITKPLVAESKNDSATIRDLYRQTSRWMLILSMPITLTLLAGPAESVKVLFGDAYQGGLLTPAVLVLGQFGMMALGAHSTFLQGLGQTRSIFYSKFAVLIVNGVLDLILIPRFGILGAAIGASAGTIIGSSIRAIVLYNSRGIHPVNSAYVRALLAIVPAYLFAVLINFGAGIFWLIMTATIVILVYGTASVLFGAVSANDISFVEVLEEALGIELHLLKRIIRYRTRQRPR